MGEQRNRQRISSKIDELPESLRLEVERNILASS